MKEKIHYPSIISCNKSCRRVETLSVYWGKIKAGLVKERLMTWISSWMSNKKRNTLKEGKQLPAFAQAHGFMAHTSLAINTSLFDVLTTHASGLFEGDSLWSWAPGRPTAPQRWVADALFAHWHQLQRAGHEHLPNSSLHTAESPWGHQSHFNSALNTMRTVIRYNTLK